MLAGYRIEPACAYIVHAQLKEFSEDPSSCSLPKCTTQTPLLLNYACMANPFTVDATEIQFLTIHLFPLFSTNTGAIALTNHTNGKIFHGEAHRKNCVAKACFMVKL